ncbi:hypothetical protein ACKWTF_003860 [Chironomus riparius]
MEKNFSDLRFEGELHPVVKVVFVSSEIIYGIIAIFCNLLVIIAFVKEPKLRRQTNYYIVSLAMADFLMGLLGIPFGVLMPYIGTPTKNTAICVSRTTLLLSSCNISIMSLVSISVKRFNILSIIKPQRNRATTKNVFREICICWILGIIAGFIPFLSYDGWENACNASVYRSKIHITFRIIFMLLIPTIILGINYFKIHQIVLNQITFERKIKNEIGSQRSTEKLMRREIRTTANISLIMLIFIITWIPVHIIYAIGAFSDEITIKRNIAAICVCVAHSNVMFHPFVYTFRMRDIRSAVLRLFKDSSSKIDSSTFETSQK